MLSIQCFDIRSIHIVWWAYSSTVKMSWLHVFRLELGEPEVSPHLESTFSFSCSGFIKHHSFVFSTFSLFSVTGWSLLLLWYFGSIIPWYRTELNNKLGKVGGFEGMDPDKSCSLVKKLSWLWWKTRSWKDVKENSKGHDNRGIKRISLCLHLSLSFNAA